MRKIAIALSKGGTGKTSTAVNLAAGLAAQGQRVLLIDTDTQGQAALALGVAPEVGLAELMAGEISAPEALCVARERLWLLAGGPGLSGIQRLIARQDFGGERLLAQALAPYAGRYDFVLLDTAPGWDSLLINVLFYAEEILAPVMLEPAAIQGLITFIQRVSGIQELRPELRLAYVLPVSHDRRVKQSSELLSQLETHFSDKLLPAIPYNIRLSESLAHGQTIYEYASSSTGAEAYRALTEQILGGTE